MPLACLSTRAERKMKGLFLTEVGRLELWEVPVPKVTAGMLRIRVCRAGVCSTDVGYWRSGSPRLRLPVILGHEVSGVIEETAPDVEQFHTGDRVIVTNDYYLCGTCRYCRSGAVTVCGAAQHRQRGKRCLC